MEKLNPQCTECVPLLHQLRQTFTPPVIPLPSLRDRIRGRILTPSLERLQRKARNCILRSMQEISLVEDLRICMAAKLPKQKQLLLSRHRQTWEGG